MEKKMNAFKHRIFTLFVVCSILVFHPHNLFAQEAENEKNSSEEEEIERINVLGQNPDIAMQAFNAGDFLKAEEEFKMNAKCALRIERNKQAFADGLQNSALNQQATSSVGGANAQSGSNASNLASSPNIASTGNFGGSQSKIENAEVRERTCDNRGFQLYMTAMSQLQLGKVEEAEKNFKTASHLNKNLYDAHYRIGLMQIMRNDVKGANSRLSSIKTVIDRCGDCESKDEIIAQADFLEKAISGEIKLR